MVKDVAKAVRSRVGWICLRAPIDSPHLQVYLLRNKLRVRRLYHSTCPRPTIYPSIRIKEYTCRYF
jgi:hypothetical protein